MSQPAPDWPQHPDAAMPPQGAPAAPAPPAPMPAPAAPGEPVTVQLPTAPGAMLDAGVPLQHATPAAAAHEQQAVAFAPAMPAAPAMPVEAAMPAAPAMPVDAAMPVEIDPAATFSGPVEPADAMPAARPASATATADDVKDAWWSPGNALLLAVAALAWQLVSFYAREQLPVVERSGEPLTRFDQVVGAMPVAGSAFGAVPGMLLAIGSLAILLFGVRRGLRDVPLQAVVGALAIGALLLTVALPALV